MPTQVDLQNSIGKTIANVDQWFAGTETLIQFDDDTFSLIGVEDDKVEARIVNLPLRLRRHGDVAVASGLFTQQQRETLRAQREAEVQAEVDARELALFNKLKAKFDP